MIFTHALFLGASAQGREFIVFTESLSDAGCAWAGVRRPAVSHSVPCSVPCWHDFLWWEGMSELKGMALCEVLVPRPPQTSILWSWVFREAGVFWLLPAAYKIPFRTHINTWHGADLLALRL